MLPSRQPHDPFTDAPLRPTNPNATSLAPNPGLRSQASQHSLRSNASTASSRTRQRGNLFAPSLSRRPISRASQRVEDDILADSDSERDEVRQQQRGQDVAVRRQGQMGNRRLGSPEKHNRLAKGRMGEELDIVVRRPDGDYLLGTDGYGDTALPKISSPEMEEDAELKKMDDHYAAIARQYFTSGTSLGGRGSKKHEEELEELKLPMMARLREQIMQKLDDERWLYESINNYQLPFR